MKKQILTTSIILCLSALALSMSQKPKTESNKKQVSPKVSGKSLGYFKTSLTTIDNGNGDLTLVARVVARNDMNDADFQWKTPKNVTVISGQKTGQAGFSAGQEKVFSIVVDKAKVSEKDQFFFFVYQIKNGERHGASQSLIYSDQDVSKSQKKHQKSKTQKTPKYYE